MLGGLAGFRVDPSATFSPTQHALAGKAALGLAQMTEQDSHALGQIPPDILEYVKTLNLTAQKAEITRNILERYLFGTAINRIDPVMVPYTPQGVSEYTVPSGDPDVLGSEHIGYNNIPVPLTNIGSIATASVFKPPVISASLSSQLLVLPCINRVKSINDFI